MELLLAFMEPTGRRKSDGSGEPSFGIQVFGKNKKPKGRDAEKSIRSFELISFPDLLSLPWKA
jgi:hypothetical protein